MLMLDNLRILFYSHPTDMRKSVNSLCILISETLHCNPADGTLFLFRNRSGNKLKALYYETNCFTIWYRKLEKDVIFFSVIRKGKLKCLKNILNGCLQVINTLVVKQVFPKKQAIFIKKS